MSTRTISTIVILFLAGSILFGQSITQFGTLPIVNINFGLAPNWEMNIKWETRQSIATRIDDQCVDCEFDFVLSDQSLVVARKIGLNSKVAAGYLLRIRGGNIFHRSIQQFSIVQRLPSLRFAHRFATDQTFSKEIATTWRVRYRLGTEIPLNGQAADPKELYLKVNNEYLGSWQGPDFGLELRLVPLLGYKFTDKSKLEFGPDFRLDRILEDNTRQRWWGVIAWYNKL